MTANHDALTKYRPTAGSQTQATAELLPGEMVAIEGKIARRSYDQAGNRRMRKL